MTSKIKVKYPLGIQWNIAENKLQEMRSSIDGNLKSDIFDIPGTDIKYYISILPNGDGQERQGQTWMFLELRFEEQNPIEAQFTISVETANLTHKQEHVYTETYGFGCSACTVDDLFDPEKRYIVNGEMVIKIDGFLMVEMDVPACQLGGSGIKWCINLWNQQNKDFTIVAEGKEIQAHKNVLIAHSPVFEAMFKPHTKEAQENKVIILDFSFEIIEAAIKFCYDSSLVQHVSFEVQMSLLQFFDKYDIRILKDDLEEHLISQVNEINVCRLNNSSIIANAAKLGQKCTEFLQDCWKTTTVNDFDILDKDFAFDLLKNSLLKFSR